jgi:PadR family transcriptional regulator PadR
VVTISVGVGFGLRRKIVRATMRCMAFGESRQTQFLRGVLDLCLLAVMEEGPAYGYEMTKRLRARGLSIVGEGSIYPLLGRLEREGLVETYRAASNGGPPRKYYRASPDGRNALAAGVSEWRAARDAVDGVLGLVGTEVGT